MGAAIKNAMITRMVNSFDKRITISLTGAPSTLRIPISFLRCIAINEINPYNPKAGYKNGDAREYLI